MCANQPAALGSPQIEANVKKIWELSMSEEVPEYVRHGVFSKSTLPHNFCCRLRKIMTLWGTWSFKWMAGKVNVLRLVATKGGSHLVAVLQLKAIILSYRIFWKRRPPTKYLTVVIDKIIQLSLLKQRREKDAFQAKIDRVKPIILQLWRLGFKTIHLS